MRGLVFTGGEGPAPESLKPILDEAGKEGFLAVAADSGLSLAEAAGVDPFRIIGDMDSLESPGMLSRYPPGRILRHPRDKDLTDTELALDFLRGRGCSGLWIIGGGGGRTDHLLGIASLFERRRRPERWITAREDIRPLRAGEDASWPPPAGGGPVSVFPLGRGPWKILSRGLRWPLDGFPWRRGRFGISNESGAGGFSLSVLRGGFLVLVPLPLYSGSK